jgi:ankyrin repeat protein
MSTNYSKLIDEFQKSNALLKDKKDCSNLVTNEERVRLIENFEKLKRDMITNEERDSILIAAAARGKKDIVILLLNNGANVNAKMVGCDGWGWMIGTTALMVAALYFYPEIVSILLDKGADVNARNNKGDTALMMISGRYRFEEMAITLLDKGADVNIKNNKGDTVLMIFCNPHYLENSYFNQSNDEALALNREGRKVLSILLERSVDVNARNYLGDTALMIAMKSYQSVISLFGDVRELVEDTTELLEEMLTILLESGADMNAMNDHGETALTYAENSYQSMVPLFMKFSENKS